MKKLLSVFLCAALLAAALPGCAQSGGYGKNKSLAASEKVTLRLTGPTSSFLAMQDAIASFTALYPNCAVEYEYVQDYTESMQTRLAGSRDVDLFITNNITADSPFLPYALELGSRREKLDLSDAYEGLIRNFTISAGGRDELYAVPLGGELRGMFVNKTLLSSLGLSVPKNYAELLACCEKLKAAGYVPLQGNPAGFGQLLMYPYICSLIANAADYQAVYDRVNRCEAGVSELFRAPVSRLYELTAKGYYNYKYVETAYGTFTDGSEDSAARCFLNLVSENGGDAVKKKDDVGTVAFMPAAMSLKSTLDRYKADFHSAIDYEFILAPVGDDGGYAYLSPAAGIAVNKNSAHTDWALEFMNYLFTRDVNTRFAAEQGIIPNTPNAFDAVSADLGADSARVCQLGQVSFRYVFFDVMKKTLTDVSKGNNPKYMQADGTMYPLEHYMAALEADFAAQR